MRKFLILFSFVCGLSLCAKDFTYNEIVYTVVDEDAKTVETKVGAVELDEEEKEVYIAGNELSGIVKLPEIVTDENGVEYTLIRLGNQAFSNSRYLLSVELPETIVEIGDNAFYGCIMLIRVNIPDAVTSIGKYSFFSCFALDQIKLPDTLKSISEGMFAGCHFKYINLPQSLLYVEEYAFLACIGLTEVNLPENVWFVEKGAFFGCTELKTLYLPDNLVIVGSMGFGLCEKLTTVYYNTSLPALATKDIFSNKTYANARLVVPQGAKKVMEGKTPWSYFVNIEEADFGSIDDVDISDNLLPVEYYNLRGERVLSPEQGQIIIERSGNRTRKIVF